MTDLPALVTRALARVDVRARVRDALSGRAPRRVLAAGKVATAMIEGALDSCGSSITHALVILPDGSPEPAADPRIQTLRAAHPLPDERSVAAGEAALAFDADLALFSGGTSSLLFAPFDTLPRARGAMAALLASGAPIHATNLVRRHASRAHGGRLGVIDTLLVSDVLGGGVADIGSGPSVPDPTTVAEARRVLDLVPPFTDLRLEESRKTSEREALVSVVASPELFAGAVAEELRREGLAVIVLAPVLDDVSACADRYETLARELLPGHAIVASAEPSLRVTSAHSGMGGRCSHLAALLAPRLSQGVRFAAIASDGVDGSSGTAGGIVTRVSFPDAAELAHALAAFNTGPLHVARGTALVQAPTGANFADLHVLIRT